MESFLYWGLEGLVKLRVGHLTECQWVRVWAVPDSQKARGVIARSRICKASARRSGALSALRLNLFNAGCKS